MPNDPPRNRYELHYAKIEALLQQPLAKLESEAVIRLQAPGFMDLVVEVLLPCQETGATILSLCHYFELNGDLCQDPEMTARLFAPGSTEGLTLTPSTNPKLGRAEALTFQQAVPPIYQEVYPQPRPIPSQAPQPVELLPRPVAQQPRSPGTPAHPFRRLRPWVASQRPWRPPGRPDHERRWW